MKRKSRKGKFTADGLRQIAETLENRAKMLSRLAEEIDDKGVVVDGATKPQVALEELRRFAQNLRSALPI